MARKITNNIVVENAQIRFRNFSGNAGQYNPKGNRNFCLLLDKALAEDLKEDGWSVKYLQPRDEDELPQAYMQIAVAFNNFPPKIYLVTSSAKTRLDEDSINILDWAEIETVDLIIRPYNWEVNGRSGVKGYVKSMYVKIVEDEFDKKYSNVPDSAQNTLGMDEDE